MGRLVKIHNGETLVVHNFVATPDYTLYVADYVGGATPPHGWQYFADDVTENDFVPLWKQPSTPATAYKLDDVVAHNGSRWKSLITGNVWEPGVSSWRNVDSDTPPWVQPSGAHDAYVKDAVVSHNGELWTSLLDANVWQPGIANWRRFNMVPPSGTIVPAQWIQPSGAGDAYALNALVLHNGFTWKSLYANNVWEPGIFGWEQQ